jgi:hypothetical protein
MATGEFSNPTCLARGAAAGKHLAMIEEVCPAPTFRIFQTRTCQRRANAGKAAVIAFNRSIPDQTTSDSSTSARRVGSTDAPKQTHSGTRAEGLPPIQKDLKRSIRARTPVLKRSHARKPQGHLSGIRHSYFGVGSCDHPETPQVSQICLWTHS